MDNNDCQELDESLQRFRIYKFINFVFCYRLIPLNAGYSLTPVIHGNKSRLRMVNNIMDTVFKNTTGNSLSVATDSTFVVRVNCATHKKKSFPWFVLG